MKDWSFVSPGPEETLEIGAELGRAIGEVGLAIALVGPLGAGKTVLVKGLAAGLGVDPRLVSSPTFVIAQQYPLLTGPRCLHHVDLYRLESEDELLGIGLDEWLEPGAVVVAEWADRFPGVLGPARLEIELAAAGRGGEAPATSDDADLEAALSAPRRARVRAFGPEAERVLADWAGRCAWLGSGELAGDAGGSAVDRPARGTKAGAPAGGGGPRGPRMRGVGLCLLAFAVLLAARGVGREAPVVCEGPEVRAVDVLGIRRVACVGRAAGGWPRDAGVGGLLFGESLDLNAASAVWLEALPGLGPVRARAIVAAREAAPFRSVAELERVHGIGPITRARVAPWLRVEGRAATPGASMPVGAPSSRPRASRRGERHG